MEPEPLVRIKFYEIWFFQKYALRRVVFHHDFSYLHRILFRYVNHAMHVGSAKTNWSKLKTA